MMKIIAIGVVALLLAFVGLSYYVSQPVVEGTRGTFTPRIAGTAEALTFARSARGLILVTRHEGDALIGTNLTSVFGDRATRDLISIAAELDTAQLVELQDGEERFPLDELVLPIGYTYPSIAAGTNFKEHAEEVLSDDPPFLFPKLVQPGEWNDPVPFLSRLDYEAELCMFPLADIDDPDSLPDFGLVLCNDFTDRWTLVTKLDLGEPLGQTGFPSGKGCERCFPTGYLVVIPRSPSFYLSLAFSLYVNDELRQQFNMKDIILPIQDIVAEAFRNETSVYHKGDEQLSLLPSGNIPRGTLILTGTAGGVIFKPANICNQAFYLQPGDVIRTEAGYLGHLENVVEAD
ncbi:MAG: fumarylacetoacetate hydrolase family protein [Proteobacteria bacterium]|nr:fumarylacetoacetate hydrolase family protein [Pseudomonadota bacterium]